MTTRINGSFPDFLLTLGSAGGGPGGFVVDGIWFVNNSSHPASGALQFKAIAGASVTNCKLQGQTSWACYNETYSCSAINCFFTGWNTSGSIGAMIGQHTSILGCDITGYYEGIRMYGANLVILGCRFEVNDCAIMIGKAADGSLVQAEGAIITGGSMERNQCGIYVAAQTASVIGAVTISGHPTDYTLDTGLHIQGGNKLIVQGMSISGQYTGAGINCVGANDVTFIEVGAGSFGPGPGWNLGANASNIECIRCNNPPLAVPFASLPTNPKMGDRKFITNCNTTTFASGANGAGSNKVPVYFDGAWKVG